MAYALLTDKAESHRETFQPVFTALSQAHMATDPTHLITSLLHEWSAGDTEALGRVYRLLEMELRAMARRHMLGEKTGHLLQPTALINEVFTKLIDLSQKRILSWRDRHHFLGTVARQMQRTLFDEARSRNALKRGAGAPHDSLSDGDVSDEGESLLETLNRALDVLANKAPRAYIVFVYRETFGLSLEEVAALLKVSRSTVIRIDQSARRFLRAQMQPRGPQVAHRFIRSRSEDDHE